ncbi:adenosylhomocysteine nucleosidase [Lachnospiraceae bacterium RM5]|nr:adenosylhomocysteine nucleosidase [Lachnospiraceae bacterium RM5]
MDKKINVIGIIGAMDEEVNELKSIMTSVKLTSKAKMDFYEGMIDGKDVVVVRSGIGKVNAGICTQILIDLFNVDVVINTGIAGSLNEKIDICDIVLSTDALQHDVEAIAFGYEAGVIPRMDESVFKADEDLVELAYKKCLEELPEINVYKGRVLSGDQFISDKEKKDFLVNTFKGYCTEMEGAAIAHCAYLNDVPFLIIRAISDKADGSAHMDYPAFEKLAIKNSVKLMKAIIGEI